MGDARGGCQAGANPAKLATMRSPRPRLGTAARLSLAIVASPFAQAQVATIVDPPPASRLLDGFNDGIETTLGFSNSSRAGETGGAVSVLVPGGAADPQFQVPTPNGAFDAARHPHFRIRSKGTVGGGSQVFPLPPAGATVVPFNVGTGYAEAALTFVTDPPGVNGSGLRIDPLGGGGAADATFSYDYIILDKYPTLGVAEFDLDGDLEGFGIAGNGGIVGASVTATTSSFAGTTAGVDPILQRAGLNADTGVFDVLEVRAAFDPDSTSRFEIFWGTSINPGPAGGQSIVVTDALIRDGEFHTYRFQMSDDARWSGTLNLLRIDPLADADAAAGRSFAIDSVRLIAGAPVVDTDGDGLPDATETDTGLFIDEDDTGSDPANPDSDGDGFDDGEEVRAGSDPNDSDSIPASTIEGYTLSPARYGLGAEIAPNAPILTNTLPVAFSVTPELPAGLVFGLDTGLITGQPSALAAAADYTVTASFAVVNIEVTNPFIDGYSIGPGTYRRGEDAGTKTPSINGASPSLFAIAPPLPEGLEFDVNTGAISGVPTASQPAGDHTVTASYDAYPDAALTLSIAVEAAPLLRVDPARAIANFTPLGEFNTDGDTELWTGANDDIAAAGGLLVVNTTAPDPQVFKTGLALPTADGAHSVLEFRLRQTDNIPLEFFWADASGGLSPLRRFPIPSAAIPADGEFHSYQIDMTGVFVGDVEVIRLDPGAAGGRTVEFDYIRLGDLSAPAPPRFVEITYDTDLEEATFTWSSNPGEEFLIEFSDDGAGWQELDDAFPAGPGETTAYLDVGAGASPIRLYRVTRVEQ